MKRAAILILCGMAVGACGKNKEALPKTVEQAAAEKAANDKAVRDNAVWGTQVQALDKAKNLKSTVEQQTEDTAKKIEDSSK